jgi:hypothetical protein
MEKIYGQEIPENEWVKDDDILKNMPQTQAQLHIQKDKFVKKLVKGHLLRHRLKEKILWLQIVQE